MDVNELQDIVKELNDSLTKLQQNTEMSSRINTVTVRPFSITTDGDLLFIKFFDFPIWSPKFTEGFDVDLHGLLLDCSCGLMSNMVAYLSVLQAPESRH